MDTLSHDLQAVILEYITPKQLLRSTVLVCKDWDELLQQDSFWRQHALLSHSCNLQEPAKQHLNRKELQKCCMYLNDPLSEPQSVLPTYRNAYQNTWRLASSTDHDRESLRYAVLPNSDNTWWSSRPDPDPSSTETLLFRTAADNTLISKLKIKPLRDPFIFGNRKVYKWKATRIRAYWVHQKHKDEEKQKHTPVHLYHHSDFENHTMHHIHAPAHDDEEGFCPHRQAIQNFRDKHTPSYVSEAIPVKDPESDHVLEYDIPNVMANVVEVELLGKNNEQIEDGGYYACIQQISCHGHVVSKTYTHSTQDNASSIVNEIT